MDENDGETRSKVSKEGDSDVGAISKEHKTITSCATLVLIANAEAHRAFNSLPGYISFPKVPTESRVYQYRWKQDSPGISIMREPFFLGTYRSRER